MLLDSDGGVGVAAGVNMSHAIITMSIMRKDSQIVLGFMVFSFILIA